MSKLEELLRANPPKPRTTVKRFAADLKARIERAAVSFAAGGFITPASIDCASGLSHAIGVVDAALSDYDVRDPEDFLRPAESAAPAGTAPPRGTCAICWPPTHLSVVDDTTTHAGPLSDCMAGCWVRTAAPPEVLCGNGCFNPPHEPNEFCGGPLDKPRDP